MMKYRSIGLPWGSSCYPSKYAATLLAILIFVGIWACTLPGTGPGLRDQQKISAGWPQDDSDLAADEKTLFGRLDNGLRYVIKENQTPPDRVSMHLYIKVGSVYERDEEQGISHFLEHMLFNGTKNFPPGEMVKYFQRIGMQFGPDANAHTGFDQTVYDVLLPRGDTKSLGEGLLVLRDYADGALLLPEEVERERKVILAEMLSRDSAGFRTVKASFQFEMPGLTIGKRFPIGVAEIIKKMDADLLKNYYEAWYRPERMFLVIVGDVQKETARQLIEKQFSDLQSKQPARPVPDFGQMNHAGVKAFHHYEKDAGSTTVSIETISVATKPKDTMKYQRELMVKDIAASLMQKRLDDLVRGSESSLTSARMGSGHYLQKLKYSEISANTNPDNWETALSDIEQALRRATVHGFTPAEVTRAKNEYRADLINDKEEEGTRDSKVLAREIMGSIRDWSVLLSPDQRVELLLKELDAITLELVEQAFLEMWSDNHRLVLVTGNTNLASTPAPPVKQIETAYRASRKVDVEPLAAKKTGEFPYLSLPQRTGDIIQREEIKDLDVTKVLFGNGITLWLKPTRFKENQVLAALSFGYGRSSEPKEMPGLAKLTEEVINESGFGTMDRTSLEDALAGRLASTDFEIREDRFVINGEAVTGEVPLLFQLLHTAIQDPGFSEPARRLAVKRYSQKYRQLASTVDGVMKLKGFKFLAGGDNRFGTPELADLQQRSLDQIKQWVGQQMRESEMELALVGDFEVEQVIELAAQYMGTLPKRDNVKQALPVDGPQFPRGESLDLSIHTETPKAFVAVAYPTEDFWDIHRTRRLSIMAELYSERLREHIREKLGAAYSPQAFNRSFRAYKGFGMTQIFIQVDPGQADSIVQEVKKISKMMGIPTSDDDEFRRVLDPTLTYIKDLRQKNQYWLDNVLSGAARHPIQLDWARTFQADYASIGIDEITALARKYLIDDHAATIVLRPETASNRQ